MAKQFTAKDARALIETHQELLQILRDAENYPLQLYQDAEKVSRMLIEKSLISDMIEQCLVRNTPEIGQQEGINRLIQALYFSQESVQMVSGAKQLSGLNRDTIQQGISALERRVSAVRWFFTSGSVKNAAASAYEHLQSLAEGTYCSDVRKLSAEMEQLRKTSRDEMWAAYKSNPAVFQKSFDRLLPSFTKSSGIAEPFAAVLRQFDALNKRIASVEKSGGKEQENVRKAAGKQIMADVMDLLRNVPVEELSRQVSGLRVKTLRENGYSSVDSIYAASVYQISSVHGISEDAARTAKQAAEQFVKTAQADGKIRLSFDRKTKEATELVWALYVCKRTSKLLHSLHELTGRQEKTIREGTKILRDAGTGINWLFLTNGQREQAASAYQTLNHLLTGPYVKEAKEAVSALKEKLQKDTDAAWKDFEQDNIAYYTLLEEIMPGCLGNDDKLYGLPEDLAREIQEEAFFPEGLLCTLRRYQEWGVRYVLHQERVLLGDEMGLGKTVQAIACMVSLRNTGATHFLVICPASVISNWCREIIKHSKLRVIKMHGPGRMSAFRSWLKTGGVGVTTYETTGRLETDDSYHIDLAVVDEAHYIKNPSARRTVNVKNLCAKAQRLLFMTGTALENKVDEMLSLIEILQPQTAMAARPFAFMSYAPQFRERVAPVYYRRKREDVLTELPELIESREWCSLSPIEKQVYEHTLFYESYAAVRRVSWNVEDLRQSSKAARMMELIREAESDGRKILVFSFFLDTIRSIAELLGNQCYGVINGSVPPQRRQEMIDGFDKAPAGAVLLAQIQSGGTGLNIQSASVVFICEPQLKPSIENQAVSRAYRMGQARNVLVYRLLCENTVDEKITEKLEQKQAEFNAFADTSVAAEKSVDLDEKTLGQIIQEEIDRINKEKESQSTVEAT